MRTFWLSVIFFFSTLAFILSSSDFITKIIAQYRYETENILGSSKYRYGDMYGLCYLPYAKQASLTKEKTVIIPNICPTPRFINLYSICDSYLWEYVKSDPVFCGVKKYQFVRYGFNETMDVHLDTTQTNIMLLESVERNIRFVSFENYTNQVRFINTAGPGSSGDKETSGGFASFSGFIAEQINNLHGNLYNEKINQNLEFNLFDYYFFNPLKEMKARLIYSLFGRLNKEVTFIKGYPNLFLNETVDPASQNSSFNPVTDNELNSITGVLDTLYKYYRGKGFDEVYFFIPPNPVSIVAPNYSTYNDIVRRIEHHPRLIMPMIDIYDVFDTIRCPVYQVNDSHWNANGFNLWINTFNEYLKKIPKKN